MPARRAPNRHPTTEGLSIFSDDASAMLLPGLSPSTYLQRLDELRQMQSASPGVMSQNTLLVPQPPSAPEPDRQSSLSYDAAPNGVLLTPRSAFLHGGQKGRLQSVSSFARTPSRMGGGTRSGRPQFIDDATDGPDEPSTISRRSSNLASESQNTSRRKSTALPGLPPDDDSEFGAFAPNTAQRFAGPPARDGPSRQSIRRGSTFSGQPLGGNSANGMSSIEHQLFKSAPSAVLAKLSSFVSNRTGDGGSWNRLSELIDMHRRGHQLASELDATVGILQRAGEQYPSSILKGTNSPAGRATRKNSISEVPESHLPPKEQLEEWQGVIATSTMLLTNMLGLLASSVPTLSKACDAVRRVALSAMYHNGRNLGTVVPMPTSVDAVPLDANFDDLKKKMELFSVDPYAVISVETDLRRAIHSGRQTDPLLLAIKAERQLKRRFEVLVTFLRYNMQTWRRNTLVCIFRGWRAVRPARLLEERLVLDVSSLKAELEFTTNSRKNQQAELAKAAADRTTLVETAESEKVSLQSTYEKQVISLEAQVSNLKHLVQSLKKNDEAVFVKEEMNKVQETNSQLETQVVKLVEHISAKENQCAALEKKTQFLTDVITKISSQLSAVTGQIGAGVQEHKHLVSKIAAIATGSGSIPPLAAWVTELAQQTMNDEDVVYALQSALTRPSSPGSVNAISVADVMNPNSRQNLVRVRDFSEGMQVLDAYIAVLHSIDSSVISAETVAEVMCESDSLAKADAVLEYTHKLFTVGARIRIAGNALRNPATFLTGVELAHGSTVRPHLVYVTSLLTVWLSTMASVSLVPVLRNELVALTQPLALETQLLESNQKAHDGASNRKQSTAPVTDPVALCTSRWESVREYFVVWRNAMLALPSLLIDYTAETSAVSSHRGHSATQHSSNNPQLMRRQSTLVKPTKTSLEERLLLGQPISKAFLQDAVKSALVPTVSALSGGKKKSAAAEVGTSPTSVVAETLSHAPPMSEEERLQSSLAAVQRLFEVESLKVVSIFRYYAEGSSDVLSHSPIMCLTAAGLEELCRDIGIFHTPHPASSSAAAGPSVADSNAVSAPLLHAADIKELLTAVTKKRSSLAAASRAAAAGVQKNKFWEADLKTAVTVDEFAVLLLRLALRFAPSLMTHRPHLTLGQSTPPPSTALTVSVPDGGDQDAAGSQETTHSEKPAATLPLTWIEDTLGRFLRTVLLPRATLLDLSAVRAATDDVAIASLLETYRPMVLHLFQHTAQLPEVNPTGGKDAGKTLSKSGGKSRDAAQRSVVSQIQAESLMRDVAAITVTGPSEVAVGGADPDLVVWSRRLFLQCQLIDVNTKPVLMTFMDFQHFLVAIAMQWCSSPVVLTFCKVSKFLQHVLEMYCEKKFPKLVTKLSQIDADVEEHSTLSLPKSPHAGEKKSPLIFGVAGASNTTTFKSFESATSEAVTIASSENADP